MNLIITAYGHPTLKKVAVDVDDKYPNLKAFIDNLFETMYYSDGVGLAAPQVDQSVRIFVIDGSPMSEHYPETKNLKRVFINPRIIEYSEETWVKEEGCLSVPDVHEEVERAYKIKIKFVDENFITHEEEFEGMAARIIQHEYDHLEGKTFVDRLSSIRKMMMRGKLNDISRGQNIRVGYKMDFPFRKKR